MQHPIHHRFQHAIPALLFFISCVFFSCSKDEGKYSFTTAEQALKACKSELFELSGTKKVNIEKLADIINDWRELRDSTFSVMYRDSTILFNNQIYEDVFNVCDSIRHRIEYLATTPTRTIPEILQLKILTCEGKEEFLGSKTYQDATKFYTDINKSPLHPNAKETVEKYIDLLSSTDSLETVGSLFSFIVKEDKCYRSIMKYYNDIDKSVLKTINDKTNDIYNQVYQNTLSDIETNKTNESIMIYLTMRMNRRIFQNVDVALSAVRDKKEIPESQKSYYRWMLLQPYMSIDSKMMSMLSDEQVKLLENLSEKLPSYLTYIDNLKDEDINPDDINELCTLLSNYIMNFYLTSNL